MPFFYTLLSSCLLFILSFSNSHAQQRIAPALDKQAKITSNHKGAQVLHSIQHSELDEQGKWSHTVYHSIRINDLAAARDYGRIAIRYNNYYDHFTLDYAKVLTKEGDLKTLQDDAIQIVNGAGSQDFYSNSAEAIFSLPQVEPGSILEFQFTRSSKIKPIDNITYDRAGPHWFQGLVAGDGWRADEVTYFKYIQSTPLDIHLNTVIHGKNTAPAKTVETEQRRVKTWAWKHIPSLSVEPSMTRKDDFVPAILSSSERNWSKVDAWSWQKVAPTIAVSPRIKAIVASFKLDNKATREEKIRAVYAYMQHHIRYVFAHLERGGYDPHSTEDILNNRYGDCKDQTILTLSLLKALGLEAYPALVQTPSSGLSDGRSPRLMFDHMIVWVPATANEDPLWLDTTGDRVLFPGIGAHLHKQPALIINGKGGDFVTIDLAKEPNSAQVDLRYSLDNQNHLIVDAQLSFNGSFEQYMRNWWKHDHNRKKRLHDIMTAIVDDQGQYELTSSALNSESLDTPMSITARFTFKQAHKTDQPMNLGVSATQLMRIFGLRTEHAFATERQNNYVIDKAFKVTLNATFKTPARYIAALTQSGEDMQYEHFRLKQHARKEGGDYAVSIEFDQPEIDITAEAYEGYSQDLRNLNTLGHWGIYWTKNSEEIDGETLAELKLKHGIHSIEYKLKESKNHLHLGQFEDAANSAQDAINSDADNAEAWFLYATATGYGGDIDKAKAAFEKAANLGYVQK